MDRKIGLRVVGMTLAVAVALAVGTLYAAKAKPNQKPARKAAKPARKKAQPAKADMPESAQVAARIRRFSPAAMRRAIADMAKMANSHLDADGALARLGQYEKLLPGVLEGVGKKDPAAVAKAKEILDFQAEVLLGNPLLNFDKLLMVVRRSGDLNKSLPPNWVGDCSLPRNGFDDEIAVLSPVRPDGKVTPACTSDKGSMLADVDLHWDAKKMLFSAIGKNGKWQVHEANIDGSGVREVTPGEILT